MFLQIGRDDVSFEYLRADVVQVGSVGEDLSDDGTSCFRIAGKLDLDDVQASRRFYGDQIGSAASKRDLSADDGEARRA